MKTYKEFINENIKDFLQPKSNDEVNNKLENMSDYDKILTIYKNKLSKNYMPKNARQIVIDKIIEILNEYENQEYKPLYLELKSMTNDNSKKDYISSIEVNGLKTEYKIYSPIKAFTIKRGQIPYSKLSTETLIKISDFLGRRYYVDKILKLTNNVRINNS